MSLFLLPVNDAVSSFPAFIHTVLQVISQRYPFSSLWAFRSPPGTLKAKNEIYLPAWLFMKVKLPHFPCSCVYS